MAIVMVVKKWKHYLMGRRFTIFTNQKSLKFLLDQRDVFYGQQKWLTKLLGYDFEIIYKAGIDKKVADGLSCVIMEQSFPIIEMMMALTQQVSTLRMQDVFDKIDGDEQIQQTFRDFLFGSCEKPVIL